MMVILLLLLVVVVAVAEATAVPAGSTVVAGMVFCDQCKDGARGLFDYPLYGTVLCTWAWASSSLEQEHGCPCCCSCSPNPTHAIRYITN